MGVTGAVASRTCVTPAAGLARKVILTVSFFNGTALVFWVDGGGIGVGVSSLMETGMLKLIFNWCKTPLKSLAPSASILFSENHRLIVTIYPDSEAQMTRFDPTLDRFSKRLSFCSSERSGLSGKEVAQPAIQSNSRQAADAANETAPPLGKVTSISRVGLDRKHLQSSPRTITPS